MDKPRRNMENPLISVILPVFNEEKHIRGTLDSLLSQTFEKFEILIIHDVSTDNTKQIIDGYASSDQRIRVFHQQTRIGLARLLNLGIHHARGKYIARMDAGDKADRFRLQKQYDYLENHVDVAVLGSWAYILNPEGRVIGEWHTPAEVDAAILYQQGGVIHPSVMCRKEIIISRGGYRTSDKAVDFEAEDFELWMRIKKYGGRIENIQENLMFYLERSEGISIRAMFRLYISTFMIKLKYLPSFFTFSNCWYTFRSFLGICASFCNKMWALRRSKAICAKKYYGYGQ